MKLLFATLFFFLLNFSLIHSQELSGTILNSENTYLEFANISLLDANNKFIQGTVSDDNGRFLFSSLKPGAFIVKIQFLGYEDWVKEFNYVENLDLGKIILSNSANELTTIVVSGQKEIIEKRGDQLLFNVSASPLKEGYDGMEVLQRTPNIWLDGDGQILMRDKQATILINGRPLNLTAAAKADYIRNLNSENINRIEIQTNAGANQDAENSGGVINIILKKGRLGLNSTLRAAYTLKPDGFRSGSAGLNFGYGSKDWNVYGSYNHSDGDNLYTKEYETFYSSVPDYYQNLAFDSLASDNHRYQIGFNFQANANHNFGLEIFGSIGDFTTSRDSEFSLGNLDGNSNDLVDFGTTGSYKFSKNNILNSAFNYSWTLDTLNSTFKIISDYSSHNLNQDYNFSSFYQLDNSNNLKERNDFNADTKAFITQAELNKKLPKKLQVDVGLKWTNIIRQNDLQIFKNENDLELIDTDRSTLLDYRESIYAAFGSVSKTFKNESFFKAGLRIERTDFIRTENQELVPLERNYTNFFPSLYFSKKLDKDNSLAASYSRRLRRPSFSLLTNNVTRNSDFNFNSGNADLQPEYIDKYEVSYQVKKNTFAVYFNKTNDAINGIYVLDSLAVTYVPLNQGSQEQYGIEYNRSGNIFKWWYLTNSFNIFYRKFTDEDGNTLFPKTTFYGKLTNTFKINSTTSLDLTGFYISPKNDAYYEAEERYEVNIILKKSFLEKRLNCRIYLNDIFRTRRAANQRVFDEFQTNYSSQSLSQSIRFWLTYNLSKSKNVSKKKTKSANDAKNRF